MTSDQFLELQEALAMALGPSIQWLQAILIAMGFGAGVLTIFLGLFRWLTRR